MREPRKTWIVLPAYNEESVIGGIVAELRDTHAVVAVVDDGSTDGTCAAAEAAGACVLSHAVNRGQGAALQTGIDYALSRGAERLVTFDADGQHAARDVRALLDALDGGVDVALGSRFLGAIQGASPGRVAFLRVVVWLSNRLSGLKLSDAHCGLRAFRADVASKLRIHQDRMAHASELLANVKKHGLSFVEVPVTISYTPYSTAKGQRPLDGLRILFDYLTGLLR